MTEDLQTLFKQQRAAFSDIPMPNASAREQHLQRCIDLLCDNKNVLCRAAQQDFGCRADIVTQMNDILPSLMALKHAKKHVKKWMSGEKRQTPFAMAITGGRSKIHFQPKGVVGIICPWNMPINVLFSPLADALAAGNKVMIKVSELAPHTSALLVELFRQYFANDIHVIQGDASVSQSFCQLPFDHLIFTGSTRVGKEVMRMAADNLTPVTLELGGKSPAIFGRSTTWQNSIEKLLIGKTLNAGQVCITADYCLIPEDQLDQFIATCQNVFSAFFPEGIHSNDYVSIINDHHYQRLHNLLEKTQPHCQQLINLDQATMQWRENTQRKLPLHLLINPQANCAIMHEEIFGPLLPVITYSSFDECIAMIKEQPRALAMYYFGNDQTEMNRLLEQTHAGGVTINDIAVHFACNDLPFGGIGASGMGQLHGYDGFKSLSHAKPIFKQGKVNLSKLSGLFPPYSDKAKKLIENMLKP